MSNFALFLVEGELLDVQLSQEISNHFFKGKSDLKILPYKTNIYSLYSQLKKDDFETDIVSIFMEHNSGNDLYNHIDTIDDIAEIFLFFDYDGHHYQDRADCGQLSSEQLEEMLSFFSNETEQGKLYISYPMIEAVHHCSISETESLIYCAKLIDAFSKTHINGMDYKTISSESKELLLSLKKTYSDSDWECIIINFLWGISYLGERDSFIQYEEYSNQYTPLEVFHKQVEKYITPKNQILILSGYPQFILDYFGKKYYAQLIENHTFCNDIKRFNFQ